MFVRQSFLVLIALFITSYQYAQTGLGSIKGTVADGDSKEPLPFCKVILFQNGMVKGGATTDFDGKFQINSVAAGAYDIEVRNEPEGYQPYRETGVIVSSDKLTFLDNLSIMKAKEAKEIQEVRVVAYKVPLIDKDGGASGSTVTREDIARLPVRSAAGVAQTVGGVSTDEGSGAMSVRGARSEGTTYFIDGVKVRGSSNLPKSAIEEVTVITGGLPANYGDAAGGLISVTTRGPSSKFFGSVEGVTSGIYLKGQDPDGYDGRVFGFDKYGYNLMEGMLSGPLWMQKDSTGAKVKPRLGFLVAANITNQLDPRPLAGGAYRIKKDARNELLANPLRPSAIGQGTFHNALFLRNPLDANGNPTEESDFERIPWRMNAQSTVMSGQANITVNTGPSTNLTFGGNINYSASSAYNYLGSLLNFSNFGANRALDWRVFGRLTQRFNNEREGSASKVKSFYYSLMMDYSKTLRRSFDQKHEDNIFNYGHVGTFTTTRRPSYAFDPTKQMYIHNGFRDVEVGFDPSESNAALAAITSQYYRIYDGKPAGNYENLFQIQQGNALRNGDVPASVYGIWGNIGSPFGSLSKSETDQIRGTGSFSLNIGDHSLSFGFELEQRIDRAWSVAPIGLWTISRQLANAHIRELDLNSGVIADSGSFKSITYNRLNSGYAFKSGTGEYGGQGGKFDASGNPILDNQSFFDYNLRKELELNPSGTDFLDVDSYNPNTFRLDMFSPDELLNSGLPFVSYYGYDHTGRKVRGNTDITNYFNSFDKNGNYRRFVGAFQPTYFAGYVMDKFAFNDIVFNLGLRVDVFDANQPVLKDPYLLYNARTVKEVNELKAGNPKDYDWVNTGAMGDDYIVYVNDVNKPSAINGFRSGNKWYNADGVPVEDPRLLRGASGIQPWLVNPQQKKPSVEAFEDYKAQVNVMPRVSFSFPISDEAAFFAHYDILTQRPTAGSNRFDPFQYQFLQFSSAVINNPNLKPQTTVDYELGFQQVLSKTSSLKIAAFYREFRNQIQLINVFEAYPASYRTFGNIDFGTVKGMTVAYDLRRTGNIRSTINYTLQFADGTGSNAQSASSFVAAGLPNLRSVFPFDYDQRHQIQITLDYRYGQGKDYNGPVIGGVNIFENTGLNLIAFLNSGTPYSGQTFITDAGTGLLNAGLSGTLNGSRLPWNYRTDLQIDKTFDLQFGKDKERLKSASLNVYFRITNVLNNFNVLGVYRATGNWDDDGYLAAAASQTSIQNQLDEQSFRDYYTMRIQNPFNISVPRTIRLGVLFNF